MPYSPENCSRSSLDMRGGNGQCGLAIQDLSKDRPPYSVESPEHFKTRNFDATLGLDTTIRTKMDRSVNDQLQDRQYS